MQRLKRTSIVRVSSVLALALGVLAVSPRPAMAQLNGFNIKGDFGLGQFTAIRMGVAEQRQCRNMGLAARFKRLGNGERPSGIFHPAGTIVAFDFVYGRCTQRLCQHQA